MSHGDLQEHTAKVRAVLVQMRDFCISDFLCAPVTGIMRWAWRSDVKEFHAPSRILQHLIQASKFAKQKPNLLYPPYNPTWTH